MLSTRFCPRGFCTIYELPEVQLRFSTCSIVLSPENPTNNGCIRRYKYSLGIAISTNFWWVPTSEETYLHDVVLIRCEVWSNVHRRHAWKAGSRQKMPGNLQRCHWVSVARTLCLRGYQIHHRCYGPRATTWPALSSVLKTPRSGGKCLKKGKWGKQTLRFNVGFVWNQRFDACLAKGHLLVMSTRTNFPLSSTLHFCTLKQKNGCHARLDGMHPCTHAALWLESLNQGDCIAGQRPWGQIAAALVVERRCASLMCHWLGWQRAFKSLVIEFSGQVSLHAFSSIETIRSLSVISLHQS